MNENNPQAEQMADDTMLTTLAAQATAIWPQECPLLARYQLAESAQILDLGCGPGEISQRVLELIPGARLLGLDVDEQHLSRAKKKCQKWQDRAEFVIGDAVNLDLAQQNFDLIMCRHLLQAIPKPHATIDAMIRHLKPNGWLHLVSEDYGMMHFDTPSGNADSFWHEGPVAYAKALGTDLLFGRKTYKALAQRDLKNIRLDYITIDTLTVPRQVFSTIWKSWHQGYSAAIAQHSRLTMEEIEQQFREMIATIEDPHGYGVWHLPVVSGQKR